jgi:aryl-alcohol dehydrogenase-like predicted oxidoreductase
MSAVRSLTERPIPATSAIPVRSFGRSLQPCSILGLGAWAMGGGGWAASWGPQNDTVSVATVHAALDQGITWVDTAAVYGLGHSEEVLGIALQGRRKDVFVATKCTRRWRSDGSMYASGEPASIRQECEASLTRLRTDYLDLFQLHHPTSDVALEATWGEMIRLREEGKTRFIGVSNFDVDAVRRCVTIGPVDSVQSSYNLIHREIEAELLPFCQSQGIAVLTYGPLAHGTLTGSFRPDRLAEEDWRRRDSPLLDVPRSLRVVEAIRPLADEYGWTPGQLAIAWVLANPDVTSAIVGARSPSQIVSACEIARADPDRSLRAEVERAVADRMAN